MADAATPMPLVISFRSGDASLASDVVDVVLARASAIPATGGVPPLVIGSWRELPRRNPAFAGGGAVAGAVAALLGLWFVNRRRAARHATA